MVERNRKLGRSPVVVVGSSAAIVLVAASPYALRAIALLPGMDWIKLGNVGQAYGAASALLSAIALVAVAYSVFLQAKEARASRRQAARGFHHELIRLALDDPGYLAALGGPGGQIAYSRARKGMYLNLWLAYWEMLFELGDLSEAELRLNVGGQFFNSSEARAFWSSGAETWSELMKSQPRAKRARFVRLVDDEYQKALAAGPPTFTVLDDSAEDPRRSRAFGIAGAAGQGLLIAAGVILGGWLTRRFIRL